MSSLEEAAFLQHLTDIDSVELIVKERLDPEVLPSDEARQVYKYAIDYYFDSQQERAVNVAALGSFEVSVGSTLLDLLSGIDVDIEADPELSIADTIEKLKSRYILREAQGFNRQFATLMSEAPTTERLQVASQAATDLMTLITRLTPRRVQTEAVEGVRERLRAYEERSRGNEIEGMGMGVKEVDDHIFNVHPGELALFGAGPKTGKSMWAIVAALREYSRNRDSAIFTLENPIDMTLDRICCAAVSVDSTDWQRGQCKPEEVKRVEAFHEQLVDGDTKIHIVQPTKGQRTPEFMLRQAQVLGVDSVIIDQMTHVEAAGGSRHRQRWEELRGVMQDLKLQAMMANLPVLAMHQVSREGKKEALKRGFHVMEDYAESSEVERSADFAFMLFQSQDFKNANQALLQIVAARRVEVRNWMVDWHPSMGHIRVKGLHQI